MGRLNLVQPGRKVDRDSEESGWYYTIQDQLDA
jgi:hypothetical protein